jgi:uncharacterized membrane protein YhhN
MKKNSLLTSILFFLILFLEIFLSHTQNRAGVFITKPLLMPLLILLAWLWGIKEKFLYLALLFSWAGDIFLMFTGQKFFLLGLSGFLIAHIFYIFLWKFQKRNLVPSLLIFLFTISAIFFLKDKLDPNLLLPVIAYCLVIGTMGVSACSQNLSIKAWNLNLLGAVLFIISDSILAWNAFIEPLGLSSFLVMITYGTAQYLIVRAQSMRIVQY